MAQLKDLLVNGDARILGTLYGDGSKLTGIVSENTTNVTAGNGLTGGGSAASSTGVTLHVGQGTGISVTADAVNLAAYGTAGTYGPSANATLAHSGTFTVPKVTTDAYGRVTASNITYTLPASGDTHYTTGLTAGASGTTTNAAATNPYIKVKDNSTHRAQIRLVGGGATTVTSDANGNITISSTDTNTNTDTVGINFSSSTGTKLYLIGSTETSGTNARTFYQNGNVYVDAGNVLMGAAWNDYAEYRNQEEEIEPGYCVKSADNGKVSKTTKKYAACDGIVSDTFGFAIGKTDTCQTPLAVAGRVLAYFEGNREDYHAGDTVCAGPNGKIMKMTREEIKEYPDRIIGLVSEIPEYETWGENNVLVNGRICIKIK